ncbi:MAG: hypothetical protein MJ252_23825 [archaeon]|nr:hypothetical protein [archaeon]
MKHYEYFIFLLILVKVNSVDIYRLKDILEKIIKGQKNISDFSDYTITADFDEDEAAQSDIYQLLSVIGTELKRVGEYNCNDTTVAEKEEDCTSITFYDHIHKCCFVNLELDNYNHKFCRKIADNKSALKDVKKAFSHAKKIDIQCSSFYFKRIIFGIIGVMLIIIL